MYFSLFQIYESFQCLFVCLFISFSSHIRCLIKYATSPQEHSLLQRYVLYSTYFLGFLFIRARSSFKKKLLLTRNKIIILRLGISNLSLSTGAPYNRIQIFLTNVVAFLIILYIPFYIPSVPFCCNFISSGQESKPLSDRFSSQCNNTCEKGEGSVNVKKKNYYYFRIIIYGVWSLYRTHRGTHNVKTATCITS